MAMAAHLPQSRLDLQNRGGQPAMFLLRVLPVVDLVRALTDQSIEVLDAVRGLEGLAQFLEDSQAMQGQRLFKALIEAAHGGLIDRRQLRSYLLQGCLGLLIGRLLVAVLQLPPELRLPTGR